MATTSLNDRPSLSQLRISGGVMCKRDCGFYGLPEWHGLCSKCYKAEYQLTSVPEQPAQQHDAAAANLPSAHRSQSFFLRRADTVQAAPGGGGTAPRDAPSLSVDFSRFEDKIEEKRRRQSAQKSLLWSPSFSSSSKKLPQDANDQRPLSSAATRPIGKSPSTLSFRGVVLTPSSSLAPNDAEVQQELDEFNAYLKQLPKAAEAVLVKRVPKLIARVLQQAEGNEMTVAGTPSSIDETSKLVTDFLEQLTDQLNHHKHHQNNSKSTTNAASPSAFRELNDEERQKLLNMCETTIQRVTYPYVFCPATGDDEPRDIELQAKIRKLSWLSPHNLATNIDERNLDVRREMDEAITTILSLDMHKNCPAKLDCISRFCKHIVRMLEVNQEDALLNADSLLPAIILLLVRTNPVRLHSNVKYIMRYANPHTLRSGEAGYFFTNLCCAVAFIEQLDAKSLDMSQAEFESCMHGGDELSIAGDNMNESYSSAARGASLASKESFMLHGIAQIKRDTESIIEQTEIALKLKEQLARLELETRQMFDYYEATMKRHQDLQTAFESRLEAIRRSRKSNNNRNNIGAVEQAAQAGETIAAAGADEDEVAGEKLQLLSECRSGTVSASALQPAVVDEDEEESAVPFAEILSPPAPVSQPASIIVEENSSVEISGFQEEEHKVS